jgi:hypothetical protein
MSRTASLASNKMCAVLLSTTTAAHLQIMMPTRLARFMKIGRHGTTSSANMISASVVMELATSVNTLLVWTLFSYTQKLRGRHF